MHREVSDSRLASERPRLERLADEFGHRPGVDRDDLVQEGWIYVWQTLRRGHEPTNEDIQKRMMRWVRKMHRQSLGGPEVVMSYDETRDADGIPVR